MHEALLKRVQSALALAILDCDQTMAALFDDVAQALAMFKGAPDWATIDAASPTSMAEGHGHRYADYLMAPLQMELLGTPDRTQRRDFWRDLLTGLIGFAEEDVGEANAAAVVWAQAFACCGPTSTFPPAAASWPAPQHKGGGEPQEAKASADAVDLLKAWITPPAAVGTGEQVKASGLTAVNKGAGVAGVTFIQTTGHTDYLRDPTGDRRFWPVRVEASGLTAEGDEAAATFPPFTDGHKAAKTPEPDAAGIASSFPQLGKAPA